MLGLQFLTEVTQPRFLRARRQFFPFFSRSSDPVDGEQLLRTLPGLEVGEGLSVGLWNHREDEEGVEGGDGSKVKEDSVRTKQRHEWFSKLEGGAQG